MTNLDEFTHETAKQCAVFCRKWGTVLGHLHPVDVSTAKIHGHIPCMASFRPQCLLPGRFENKELMWQCCSWKSPWEWREPSGLERLIERGVLPNAQACVQFLQLDYLSIPAPFALGWLQRLGAFPCKRITVVLSKMSTLFLSSGLLPSCS